MALLDKFLFLLFSFCFISVHCYEYVPVYMWETSKNYSPLPALGRINEEFFRDILLDKLNKDKVVVVFLEENLSPEDFTTFDSAGNNVFYALSHIKLDAQVNYYPFVEAPLKAVQNLPGVKVSKVDVTPDGLPAGTKVEPGQVLVVDLNDAKENEDRSQMLSRHDSLVASIYKNIASEYENVIALFTARHSSWLVPSELDESNSGRKVRHLLATEEETPKKSAILLNATSTLIYLKSPVILNLNGTFTMDSCEGDLTVIDENRTSIKCGKDADEVTLNFNFESYVGYWYLNSIEVLPTENGANFTFNLRDLFAPFGFSYHCNNTFYEYEDKTLKYNLSLPGFQLERFENMTPSSFSEAFDCVGFTTAPIWSGIFVTFILAMIMTFGLCMIMDIKTMDRFDDPKGKTISINVVE